MKDVKPKRRQSKQKCACYQPSPIEIALIVFLAQGMALEIILAMKVILK